jgi:hypothetical protein
MKIRPVGAGAFHADGKIDMKKLIVAIYDSANEPKIYEYRKIEKVWLCP